MTTVSRESRYIHGADSIRFLRPCYSRAGGLFAIVRVWLNVFCSSGVERHARGQIVSRAKMKLGSGIMTLRVDIREYGWKRRKSRDLVPAKPDRSGLLHFF